MQVGDGSLHGRRKGEVMGKWKKNHEWVIGRLESTWERGKRAASWAWESLGLVMGLGGAKGRNEQWSPIVFLLNTLQCFGPHFFQKSRINVGLIASKNRLNYLSIHI